MATDDKKAAAAKKAASKEAAAKKKQVAAKQAAAKKTTAAKKAPAKTAKATPTPTPRKRSGHPAPISGKLKECNGKIGIQVGKDFYPLETLAKDHDDAQLTLKFKFSQEAQVRSKSDQFLQLAGLLNTFLTIRAFGEILGDATCCHNQESDKAADDKKG